MVDLKKNRSIFFQPLPQKPLRPNSSTTPIRIPTIVQPSLPFCFKYLGPTPITATGVWVSRLELAKPLT